MPPRRHGRPARLGPCTGRVFFGTIDVDIEGELAQLEPLEHRPLRVRDTLF